jgi:tetratricopeptide (TPR) repeat protein
MSGNDLLFGGSGNDVLVGGSGDTLVGGAGADPRLALAYSNRGGAYGKKGNYDQEIADETKAIELDPDSGRAYYERGDAYAAKGDPTKAVTDFRAAARLIPASNQGHDQALARLADLERQLAPGAPLPQQIAKPRHISVAVTPRRT